jgi:TonB family protein
MELVTLGSLPGPGRLGFLRPAMPVEDAAEPEEDEEEEEEEGSGGLELIRSGMAAGERLGGATLERLASLTPSVIGPVPEPAAESPDSADAGDGTDPRASDGEDPEGLRIREGTSDLTYERLSNEELLELERLSALRPELALLSPSSWLMVQNPTEVGAFMRDRFRSPAPDEKPQGYLSVSVWIDERGSVEWAEINRSSGRPELDASALELFQRVVAFRPARNEGLRVPVAAIFWLMW